MCAPASRLEKLSLDDDDDDMPPRTRLMQSRNGRHYDLSALSPAQAEAARDGFDSDRHLLNPSLRRAVYPEVGSFSFVVTETHTVKIPAARGDSQEVTCTCPTFRRSGLCSHISFVYSGCQGEGLIRTANNGSEKITTDTMSKHMVENVPRVVGQEASLIEKINLQVSDDTQARIDQKTLEIVSIFEPSKAVEDQPSRKKVRRERESSEDTRPTVSEMRTHLDINKTDFFANTIKPEGLFTQVIVPGDALESLKGFIRYDALLRSVLSQSIDDRFLAKDFIDRLRHNFDQWHFLWLKYKNDNRTTVPTAFISQFAEKVRGIVANLREYDEQPRSAPEDYYSQAIDFVTGILGRLSGAELDYPVSRYSEGSERNEKDQQLWEQSHAAPEGTNLDIFEKHTRQNKNSKMQLPEKEGDKNVFINLIVSPPAGSNRLVDDIVRLLTQWAPHLTEDNMSEIGAVGQALSSELRKERVDDEGSSVPIIPRRTAQEIIAPLRRFVDEHKFG